MSAQPRIYFDTPPRVDRIALAVLPIDGVSGAIVRGGVSARIEGLPDKPIVNASGMLVFINLAPPPVLPDYQVIVEARDAGYFDPKPLPFTPPDINDPKIEEKRKHSVFLVPRPEFPFPSGTTLIRGVATLSGQPAPGIIVAAQPPLSTASFETLTGDNGAFALALRPHPEGPVPLTLTIRFEQEIGGNRVVLHSLPGKELVPGRSHSFSKPVDLNGSNDSDFFTI